MVVRLSFDRLSLSLLGFAATQVTQSSYYDVE